MTRKELSNDYHSYRPQKHSTSCWKGWEVETGRRDNYAKIIYNKKTTHTHTHTHENYGEPKVQLKTSKIFHRLLTASYLSGIVFRSISVAN